MLMLKRPQSELYVPYVPRESPEAKAPQLTRLPVERATIPTRDAFRAIAWDETVAPASVNPRRDTAPLRLREPMRSTRAAFASINWSGEPVTPPTPKQSKTSVRSVLAGFDWSE